jgi:transposase
MGAKLYRVTLTEEERQELISLVEQSKGPAGKRKRAHILLMADEAQEDGGWKDTDIVKALQTSCRTVERTRQKCVEQGVEAAINHSQPRKMRSKILDGEAEARLVQLACSPAPEGYERWTLQLLADRLIELEVVETVSDETVRTTLKKMNLSRG